MRIFLIGMKHVGKSTVGRLLARRRGLSFIDLDDRVLEAASAHTPRPLGSPRDVYQILGAEQFRQIEATELQSLCSEEESEDSVVALGGGATDQESAETALSGAGTIVYLREDLARVWDRVIRRGVPAYLSSANPRAEFMELARWREQRFLSLADLVVELGGSSAEDAALRVDQALQEYERRRHST